MPLNSAIYMLASVLGMNVFCVLGFRVEELGFTVLGSISSNKQQAEVWHVVWARHSA